VRLIKGLVRRTLSALGYTIVSSAQVQQIHKTLGSLRNGVSELQRELAETKSGVSTLQGESGENLSHVVVMRQELRQALEFLQGLAADDRASREAGPSHFSPTSTRIFSLPHRLEQLATKLSANSWPDDLRQIAGKLARHYLQMADLVALHWLSNGHFPADPYPEDDVTVAYAKRIAAFVPEADGDADAPHESLPWRSLWTDPGCMCFLVIGNGTAANRGMPRHNCECDVYNFDAFRLRCTPAADPLAGSTGNSGSIWSRLGDQLIQQSLAQRVLFVPLAFAGSQITDWIPGGSRHSRIALALSRLRKELVSPLLPFSAVLWQPGGAPELSNRVYQLHCHDIIADLRANGIFAPVFVAIANESKVRNAAEQIIPADPTVGIFAGPNLDTVRFASTGKTDDSVMVNAERAAELWLSSLSAHSSLLIRPDL
jgi:hypothetical protein